MWLGLVLLVVFLVCGGLYLGFGLILLALAGIVIYQPFRLLRLMQDRTGQLVLGGVLAIVIWLILAPLGGGGVQGYFGMGTLIAIVYFVFWLATP